jgi:hypothetical protein
MQNTARKQRIRGSNSHPDSHNAAGDPVSAEVADAEARFLARVKRVRKSVSPAECLVLEPVPGSEPESYRVVFRSTELSEAISTMNAMKSRTPVILAAVMIDPSKPRVPVEA